MTKGTPVFDWHRINEIARVRIAPTLQRCIEETFCNFVQDHKVVNSEDRKIFSKIRLELDKLLDDELSDQLEPIQEELDFVRWYLEVMSQKSPVQMPVSRYFLYAQIWIYIGRAGVELALLWQKWIFEIHKSRLS